MNATRRMSAEESATASSVAKTRLIIAGEKLFAQRAIEAVSLREIAVAAGHGNNNAVQYHFGSKEGLIQAIFAYRVQQMDGPRRDLLAEAEAKERLRDARTLLEILCLPQLALVDDEGRHTYAGFLSQYIMHYRPRGLRHTVDELSEGSGVLRRLLQLIEERIDFVPGEIAQSRISLCSMIFYNMLVQTDSQGLARTDRAAFNARIDDALEMMTLALCAPYRHRD